MPTPLARNDEMSADELRTSAAAARRTASGIEAFVAGQNRAAAISGADEKTLKGAIEILRNTGHRIEGPSHARRAKEQRFDTRLREAEACVNQVISPPDVVVLATVSGNTFLLTQSGMDIWLRPSAGRPLHRSSSERVHEFMAYLRDESLSRIAYRLARDDDPLKTGGDIPAGVAKVLDHIRESVTRFSFVTAKR